MDEEENHTWPVGSLHRSRWADGEQQQQQKCTCGEQGPVADDGRGTDTKYRGELQPQRWQGQRVLGSYAATGQSQQLRQQGRQRSRVRSSVTHSIREEEAAAPSQLIIYEWDPVYMVMAGEVGTCFGFAQEEQAPLNLRHLH